MCLEFLYQETLPFLELKQSTKKQKNIYWKSPIFFRLVLVTYIVFRVIMMLK